MEIIVDPLGRSEHIFSDDSLVVVHRSVRHA